jgi:taurine dioxygenase
MLSVVKDPGSVIGAEIRGVDLSRPLDDARFTEIVDAFHSHEVVVFRGQQFTPEQHIAFSRRFGELDINVRSRFNKREYPEILVVSNILENGEPIGVQDAGRYWHSDLCYLPRPSRCTLLYALEVPVKDGVALGDTLFASASAAYAALPEELKQRLAGRKAVNSYTYTYDRKVREFNRTPVEMEGRTAPPDVLHPVVRTHPFTGVKCLYVNEGYTTSIEGLPRDESDRILEFLFEHIVRPEFVYRHRWRAGDLLMWDNCFTQHKAVFDYAAPLRRRMERTTITGTVPY